MYNSVTISLLSKTGREVNRIYKNSLICKVVTTIGNNFSRAYLNSRFYNINNSIKNIFLSSFVYKIVFYIFGLLDWIFNGLFDLRKKITKGSKVSQGLEFYSKDEISGLRLFYETFILLGIFILIGNLFGRMSMPLIGSVLLIVIGLLGLLINGREISTLKDSVVFNFFFDLFKLDEGGENWW